MVKLFIEKIHLQSVDSTNAWAKRQKTRFSRGTLTAISTDHQSAGRGRFSKNWISPAGDNVLLSLIFHLPPSFTHTQHLPGLLALSCVDLLQDMQIASGIKWPNDVLIGERKVAGILAETVDQSLCILGIGLNVNMERSVASTIDRPTTSLLIECEKRFSVRSVREKLTQIFNKDLSTFLGGGVDLFFQRWKTLAARPGQMLTVHDGKQLWQGLYRDILTDGSLILEIDGKERRFYSGDVTTSPLEHRLHIGNDKEIGVHRMP